MRYDSLNYLLYFFKTIFCLPFSYGICPLFLVYGVFARKVIQKRTQFGPLEGTKVETEPAKDETKIMFKVRGILNLELIKQMNKEVGILFWIWILIHD